jgi:hypothetical protein
MAIEIMRFPLSWSTSSPRLASPLGCPCSYPRRPNWKSSQGVGQGLLSLTGLHAPGTWCPVTSSHSICRVVGAQFPAMAPQSHGAVYECMQESARRGLEWQIVINLARLGCFCRGGGLAPAGLPRAPLSGTFAIQH